MEKTTQFIMQDVRCFAGRQAFNIRPLTFLVGENSTGKSTMLGCYQAFCHYIQSSNIDFNNPPYQMGAYANIARETNAHADLFVLGFVTEGLEYFVTLQEREDGSEPIVKELKMIFDDGEVTIKHEQSTASDHDQDGILDIEEYAGNKFLVSLRSKDISYILFYFSLPYSRLELNIGQTDKKPAKNLKTYMKQKNNRFMYKGNVYSFAPIRNKPERTYNPLKETPDPEGSDMPMVLRNLLNSENRWEALKKQLEDFGKASGLFSNIQVRKFGESAQDPFQIQIKARGAMVNLADVGYGTSQILPLLVRIFLDRGTNTFLLQQPEVHLHPKAQAALGSLLAQLVQQNKNFIVETHSDALLNRARIEIMQGKINPDDVSLIYLEPDKNKVKVHNITFDNNGNMDNVPESYRDFFLQEQDKLLGFED